jgi:hypothetical protein
MSALGGHAAKEIAISGAIDSRRLIRCRKSEVYQRCDSSHSWLKKRTQSRYIPASRYFRIVVQQFDNFAAAGSDPGIGGGAKSMARRQSQTPHAALPGGPTGHLVRRSVIDDYDFAFDASLPQDRIQAIHQQIRPANRWDDDGKVSSHVLAPADEERGPIDGVLSWFVRD